MRVGIVPLARATFDVTLAEEKLASMIRALESTGHEILGSRELLLDVDATEVALAALSAASIDQLLLMQVTFTDASMTVAVAEEFGGPVAIWAIPEPRLGGRLRLNSLCGLNLASHALGLQGRRFSWLYADPERVDATQLDDVLSGQPSDETSNTPVEASALERTAEGQQVVDALRGSSIVCIGKHPPGFATSAYSAERIRELADISVVEVELNHLFDQARSVSSDEALAVRHIAESAVDGIADVDQGQLDRSLRLKAGLDRITAETGCDAFAVRCWPETFTEYGAAICGPMSMMADNKVPCACEADVYGALSQLLLQQASGEPVFLTDLVDVDVADDSAVLWHCGQAPRSMCDPSITPTATIHTNREMPLLYQFALKPGPVTLMRISQAFNRTTMVLGFGRMLERPMAFTGTSGVVRFEHAVSQVLDDIIDGGLEHHLAVAYGDHRVVLRSVAAALEVPVLEL